MTTRKLYGGIETNVPPDAWLPDVHCGNCGQLAEAHINGDCLFDATAFRKETEDEFNRRMRGAYSDTGSLFDEP